MRQSNPLGKRPSSSRPTDNRPYRKNLLPNQMIGSGSKTKNMKQKSRDFMPFRLRQKNKCTHMLNYLVASHRPCFQLPRPLARHAQSTGTPTCASGMSRTSSSALTLSRPSRITVGLELQAKPGVRLHRLPHTQKPEIKPSSKCKRDTGYCRSPCASMSDSPSRSYN